MAGPTVAEACGLKHPVFNVTRNERTHEQPCAPSAKQHQDDTKCGSYLKTTTASGNRQECVNRWPARGVLAFSD